MPNIIAGARVAIFTGETGTVVRIACATFDYTDVLVQWDDGEVSEIDSEWLIFA